MRDKKEVIRKAAIKIFAEQGFHKATTDRIAEEAGVAVGTIYNYFQNKVDVLEYIFQVEYEKRKTFFEELMLKEASPMEKIRSILEKHFAEVREEPALIKIILEERQHTCVDAQGRAGLRKFIEEIIKQGVKEGHLRNVDAEILAVMLFGSIEAIMREYLIERGHQPEEEGQVFDRALEEIMKLFRKGLFR